MSLKRVKWRNHPVLGNLAIDFTNPVTGQPFESVLFAGENGTGKTSILESLSTFLNLGTFEWFDFIEYSIGGVIYRAIPGSHDHKNFFAIENPDGSRRQVHSDRSNNRASIDTDTLDLRHYGCVFSKARADYKTKQIQSTTTKKLDIDRFDTDSEDDFTSLKQLVVDIENQDNSDYANANRNGGGTAVLWDHFYPNSKIYRFKSAFDNFFDKIKYDRVADLQGEKTILFQKHGQSISIDKLSTGEKQIVFRGVYLLRNSSNLNGAAVMIDEPELSLHPKWQKNILKYYKELFTQAGVQRVQLFFASHSEHVLAEALSHGNSNLVIVLNDNNGTIISKRIDAPSVLPSITAAETNYLAFDIVSNDYHIELYGWLQDKASLPRVKDCDTYISTHALFNPVPHTKASNYGTTTYSTLPTFIRNAIHHPDPARTFTEAELRTSIELLVELCR
jgi:predicted ATPase